MTSPTFSLLRARTSTRCTFDHDVEVHGARLCAKAMPLAPDSSPSFPDFWRKIERFGIIERFHRFDLDDYTIPNTMTIVLKVPIDQGLVTYSLKNAITNVS